MVQSNNFSKRAQSTSLAIHMFVGAALALAIILVFLSGGNPNPEWPTYWRVRPLLVVPFAGAMGGLCWFLLDSLRARGGWQKIAAIFLGVVIYIIGLWMGMVLGLVGTYWD